MPDDDLSNQFLKYTDKASKVKLPGGVVGKLSYVLISVCVSAAVIAAAAQNIWVSVAAISAVFVLVLVLGICILVFANKNPHAALFEGAEFLLHEQMKMGMKSEPVLPIDPSKLTTDPDSPPRLLPPSEAEQDDSAGTVE